MSTELPIMNELSADPTMARQAKTLQNAVTGLSENAKTNADTASRVVDLMGSWGQWGAIGIMGACSLALILVAGVLLYFITKADREQHSSDIKMTISAQQMNVETLAHSQEKQVEQISKTWEAQTSAMTRAVDMNTRSVEKLADQINKGQQAIQKTLSGDK